MKAHKIKVKASVSEMRYFTFSFGKIGREKRKTHTIETSYAERYIYAHEKLAYFFNCFDWRCGHSVASFRELLETKKLDQDKCLDFMFKYNGSELRTFPTFPKTALLGIQCKTNLTEEIQILYLNIDPFWDKDDLTLVKELKQFRIKG